MKQQWQQLGEKFQQITPREQVLIFISGLVLVVMLPFSLFIEGNLANIDKKKSSVAKLTRGNQDLSRSINEFSQALTQDPNQILKKEITQYEKRLAKIDEQLVTLTEELINPFEMRQALVQLLKLQKGVSILSLEVLPAEALLFSPLSEDENSDKPKEPLIDSENNKQEVSLGLYRHAIQITLQGKYFQLRDYLKQLEDLPWKFFWHDFHYQLKEYPVSELKIEIYSLSINQEFVGV